MFALVKNDNTIKLFQPYTIWEDKNGVQYSPETLLTMSVDQKQDLGIYDVAYSNVRADDRFYIITQNEPEFDQAQKIVKITYTSTPRELEDSGDSEMPVLGLKSQCVKQVKANATAILSATNWMIVRKIERNIDIPAATATHRAAVITECDRLEAAINAATTVEELAAAVDSANWPVAAE